MNELAVRYGEVLYGLPIPEAEIRTAADVMAQTPELGGVLANPVVALSRRQRVIERVFAQAGCSALMVRFLQKLCEAGGIEAFPAVFEAWQAAARRQAGCLEAQLYYVTAPDAAQLAGLEAFLKQRFGAEKVSIRQIHSPALVGGFLLKAGDTEFDYSLRGRMQKLRRTVAGR